MPLPTRNVTFATYGPAEPRTPLMMAAMAEYDSLRKYWVLLQLGEAMPVTRIVSIILCPQPTRMQSRGGSSVGIHSVHIDFARLAPTRRFFWPTATYPTCDFIMYS